MIGQLQPAEVEWRVGWVVVVVERFSVFVEVLVDGFRLDFVKKRVGVCKQKQSFLTVVLPYVVVVEVVHQRLRQVEDAHTNMG